MLPRRDRGRPVAGCPAAVAITIDDRPDMDVLGDAGTADEALEAVRPTEWMEALADGIERRRLVGTTKPMANARSSVADAAAIADLGRPVRIPIGNHRVTEAPTPVLRRTSYGEPVEVGIPRPQARPLPYR
jgi:hypothetical protein